MSRFMRFFSGKFLYFGKFASVKHLTNIMSGVATLVFLVFLRSPDSLWNGKPPIGHMNPPPPFGLFRPYIAMGRSESMKI